MLKVPDDNQRPRPRRRGKRNKAAQLARYREWLAEGFEDARIELKLLEEFPDTAVRLRTLRYWDALDRGEQSEISANFTLDAIGDDAILSDGYPSLLELLREMYSRDENGKRTWFLCNGTADELPNVTKREAHWYCRISKLATGMDKSSIYLLAMVYAFREECMESSSRQKLIYDRVKFVLRFGRLLNKDIRRDQTTERYPLNLNLNDLHVFMAFRPWSGGSENLQYLRAIRDSEENTISVEEFAEVSKRKLKQTGPDEDISLLRQVADGRGKIGAVSLTDMESDYFESLYESSVAPPPMPSPIDLLAMNKLHSLLEKLNPHDIDDDSSIWDFEDESLTIFDADRREEFSRLVNNHWATEPPFNYDYSKLTTGAGSRWVSEYFLDAHREDHDNWGDGDWGRFLAAIRSTSIDPSVISQLEYFVKWCS